MNKHDGNASLSAHFGGTNIVKMTTFKMPYIRLQRIGGCSSHFVSMTSCMQLCIGNIGRGCAKPECHLNVSKMQPPVVQPSLS